MIYFLTSSTTIPNTNILNPKNDFIKELKRQLPNRALRGLFICSDPDTYEKTDKYGNLAKISFEEAGFCFDSFKMLDRRNIDLINELLMESDIIILAGGHVVTQNIFFEEIKLKQYIKEYKGVLVGISAGSMNSAEITYAHPERDGEATSKEFKKFIPGLGITKAMTLPHYDSIKDDILDGLRVFEDIAYPDSIGHKFYALEDGSYIYGYDGKEELRGEAYLIQDGTIKKINDINNAISI